MTNKGLFYNDIVDYTTRVVGIYYTTKFGEDVFFDENEYFETFIDYDLLIHNDDPREFLMFINYSIKEKDDERIDEKDENQFLITVEGQFKISDEINEDIIEETAHTSGLSLLISFLRTSVYNITAMTAQGPYQIPPINAMELHRVNIEKNKTGKNLKKHNS